MTDFENFLNSYIEAMFWANTNVLQDGEWVPISETDLGGTFDADNLSADVMELVRNECKDFFLAIGDLPEGYSYSQAGHDFALTRNGHGAGFWDRGLGEVGDRLTDLAHGYGEQDFLIEDGTVFVN